MRRVVWADLPIGRKALIVIAVPVLPLIVTAVLYFNSAAAYDGARADAERAAQNRLLQAELFSLVVEAESFARGFLLVGNPVFLDQHGNARAAIRSALGALASSTTDPEQRRQLPLLNQLVAARLAAFDAVLGSKPASGPVSPAMLTHITRGSDLMGQVRREMAVMEQIQARVLADRAARLRQVQAQSNAIVLFGSAAGVLGGLGAALLFTTGITRRLDVATWNMSRLASREPLLQSALAGDEIGTLAAGTQRAAQLLDERDRLLDERMQELEALTRELEAFSYSVSHDLRAPLRHIAGFATMLQKSAGEALTDQQRRHIKVIVEAAARMGNLIDDLLAFSRTGRAELRQVPVDVEAVVRDVQQQLMTEVNGRTVRWVVHPLPRLHGDPAMLRVVFDNLLANAVKYTRPRDEAQIEIGSRPDGDGKAVIYVRDNGVGFDMQYENKLFGVFQRLHSSDEFEGTGIGLATVRRIVARHGGRVWAEARPEEGATFYVSLPQEEKSA